jgi:hypothetical protein
MAASPEYASYYKLAPIGSTAVQIVRFILRRQSTFLTRSSMTPPNCSKLVSFWNLLHLNADNSATLPYRRHQLLRMSCQRSE